MLYTVAFYNDGKTYKLFQLPMLPSEDTGEYTWDVVWEKAFAHPLMKDENPERYFNIIYFDDKVIRVYGKINQIDAIVVFEDGAFELDEETE